MKTFIISISLFFMHLFAFSQEAQNLYPVKLYGRWGYIDKTGDLLVSPVFEYAHFDFYKTVNLVKDTSGYFLIDNTGKELFQERYLNFNMGDSKGIVSFKNRLNKWGCVDTTGKIVIPFVHDEMLYFNDGIAVAFRENSEMGYYDRNGFFYVVSGYEQLVNINEGYLMTIIGSDEAERRMGIFDTHSNTEVIKPCFRLIQNVKNGHAVITDTLHRRNGVIDVKNGSFTIQPQKGQSIFSSVYTTSIPDSYILNDLYSIRKNNKTRITDANGKTILKLKGKYKKFSVLGFYNGNGMVIYDKKKGSISADGKVLIEPVYDEMRILSNGLIPVSTTGKWGYIDVKEKKIVPFKYTDALPLINGLGMVFTDGTRNDIYEEDSVCKMGYVDASGMVVWEPSN